MRFPFLLRISGGRSLIRGLVLRGVAALGVFAAAPLTLSAQSLRAEPIVFGDGRVTVAGDLSASFSCAWAHTLDGCASDDGYFNYSNYENNLLRTFRINVSAAVKASDRISILSEVRSDNLQTPQPYALYIRLRPWPKRRFDLQAGRIPPSFGAFSRRPYPADNLLIGYPLAYQYLTSLRADALPADADELLRMRGRGWLTNYSVGDLSADVGLPLVNGLVWDTGVQVHAASDLVDMSGAVTLGTLANPRVRDNNRGRQVSGRAGFHPLPGLIAGVSAAHGPIGSRGLSLNSVDRSDDGRRPFTQTAWGADLEYSRGYYLVRAEAIINTFRLPVPSSSSLATPLRSLATSVEGRYKLGPGVYVAARYDRLTFNSIAGTVDRRDWEAPLWRIETGIGYSLQRNLLLKLVYQHNERDGGRIPVVSLAAAQLVYWF